MPQLTQCKTRQKRWEEKKERSNSFYRNVGIENMCLRCGRSNHTTPNRTRRETLKCSACNRLGHVSAVCNKKCRQSDSRKELDVPGKAQPRSDGAVVRWDRGISRENTNGSGNDVENRKFENVDNEVAGRQHGGDSSTIGTIGMCAPCLQNTKTFNPRFINYTTSTILAE